VTGARTRLQLQPRSSSGNILDRCLAAYPLCSTKEGPVIQGAMSRPSKFLLISLPASITNTNDKEEALSLLTTTVGTDNGSTSPFTIPTFKIGTLDALVQQADDLAKINAACEAVVNKVGDSLRSILDGDESKIAQQKTVNDSTVSKSLSG
jgi:V-type H+-transporting ATPase subunit C